LDTRSGLDVAQAVQPLGEGVGLANLNHGPPVALRLHMVNGGGKVVPCGGCV
jgi:hypothetical protein